MNKPLLAPQFIDGASAGDYRLLAPSHIPQAWAQVALAAAWIAALYGGWGNGALPDFAAWSATLWSGLALVSGLLLTPRVFTLGYLVSLLGLLIAWRVAAMNDARVLMGVSSLAAVVMAAQFIDCVVGDLRRHRGTPVAWLCTAAWQLTAVRMTFGLNEVGHATEKLFAGLGSFHTLEKGFQGFGITHGAGLFVVLGGLIELASAISVGLGLFARLGALVSIVYFLVATLGFGGEWTRGYAWASPGGGGWEYVLLLLVVFGGVMLTGAGKFSVDGWLLRQGFVPGWMVWLCTNRAGARLQVTRGEKEGR